MPRCVRFLDVRANDHQLFASKHRALFSPLWVQDSRIRMWAGLGPSGGPEGNLVQACTPASGGAGNPWHSSDWGDISRPLPQPTRLPLPPHLRSPSPFSPEVLGGPGTADVPLQPPPHLHVVVCPSVSLSVLSSSCKDPSHRLRAHPGNPGRSHPQVPNQLHLPRPRAAVPGGHGVGRALYNPLRQHLHLGREPHICPVCFSRKGPPLHYSSLSLGPWEKTGTCQDLASLSRLLVPPSPHSRRPGSAPGEPCPCGACPGGLPFTNVTWLYRMVETSADKSGCAGPNVTGKG